MSEKHPVGLVGLGLVGKALAARLIAHGYRVHGYDIEAAARDQAAGLGVSVVPQCDLVAQVCATIILSLPDSPAVNVALWGDGGLGHAVQGGSVILDTTTSRPKDTMNHHARLAERDARFVDVPLVGSSQDIAEGNAVALVGDCEDAADYAPIIRTFARAAFFLGEPGLGHRAKLAVNLVLGLNRLVLAEGLSLAQKVGLDTAQYLEILRTSAAYSRIMDSKGPRMIRGDFRPAARLTQHAKDVSLILEMAAESEAQTPVSELHAALLDKAIQAGWGGLDNSAIIKAYTG